MRNWRLSIGLTAMVFAAGFCSGIAFRSTPAASAQDAVEDDDPCAGFYPTKTMQNFMINRVTEDMAEKYHFNDVQLENTRALIRDRVPTWMEKNKDEIRQLSNFWFESLVSDNPPDPEQVAGWAKRVMPLVTDFTGIVQETSTSMRDFLNEEQTARLDSELAAMNMGLSFVTQRLGTWSEGGYDWQTEWVRGPQFRGEQERRQKQVEEAMREVRAGREYEAPTDEGPRVDIPGKTTEVADHPTNDPTPPKADATKTEPAKPKKSVDAWVTYTEQFEIRYHLGDEQKQKARQILSAMMEKRDKQLALSSDKIDAAYKKMSEATDKTAKEKAAEAYVRLNAPIDKLFEDLKIRLEKVPTQAQRAQAAKEANEKDAKAKKSSADKGKKSDATSATEPPATDGVPR